jgi:hypothetical protein
VHFYSHPLHMGDFGVPAQISVFWRRRMRYIRRWSFTFRWAPLSPRRRYQFVNKTICDPSHRPRRSRPSCIRFMSGSTITANRMPQLIYILDEKYGSPRFLPMSTLPTPFAPARDHARAKELIADTNSFVLESWPFASQAHRDLFVRCDFAALMTKSKRYACCSPGQISLI